MNFSQPTNATQAKDRLYAQLATRFARLSRTISQTADLCEHLQIDLQAMKTFAGLHAATFMTVASELNREEEDDAAEEGAT